MFPLTRLMLKNLFRHRLRSLLTGAGIVVAVLAFGLLRTMVDAFYAGAEAGSAHRLITRHAVSLAFTMPLSYRERIRRLPGVSSVSYANWFGGVYISEKNFFPQFAIEPESYLALYPEYVLPEVERRNFVRDRRGAIAGRKLAERYGWKPGDQIPIRGTFYPGTWSFTLAGIYDVTIPNGDAGQFFFHYAYLNEVMRKNASPAVDQVGVFVVGIDDPIAAPAISLALDGSTKNSLAETLTETERAFQMSFVAMASAIVTVVEVVSVLIVLVILAVMGNTLAMTVRERRAEYATMKALGFGPGRLVYLILGESLSLAVVAGLLGLALLFPAADYVGEQLGTFFPVFTLSNTTLLLGLGAAVMVGTLAAVWPCWYVLRVPVTAALRSLN